MCSRNLVVRLLFLCISSIALAGPGEKFQQHLNQSLVQNPLVYGAVMSVHAPSKHLHWSGASGLADPKVGRKLTPRDPFLIHSVSKLFTATLILQLHEQLDEHMRLSLSDRIDKYLPCSSIKGLHVIDGHDYSCEIIIDQLGHHTSGLADYTTDGDADEYGLSPFVKLAFSNPDKYWRPSEIISYTRDHL
jgi:D-alanyl-D-alanine carboxypeptidase